VNETWIEYDTLSWHAVPIVGDQTKMEHQLAPLIISKASTSQQGMTVCPDTQIGRVAFRRTHFAFEVLIQKDPPENPKLVTVTAN
jgi:hypothetical protein